MSLRCEYPGLDGKVRCRRRLGEVWGFDDGRPGRRAASLDVLSVGLESCGFTFKTGVDSLDADVLIRL